MDLGASADVGHVDCLSSVDEGQHEENIVVTLLPSLGQVNPHPRVIEVVGPGDTVTMTSNEGDGPAVVGLQLLLPEELGVVGASVDVRLLLLGGHCSNLRVVVSQDVHVLASEVVRRIIPERNSTNFDARVTVDAVKDSLVEGALGLLNV